MPAPVEFLNSEPPEPDRSLPQASRRAIPARVAAVLVVLTALVAWAATRPDGTGQRAATPRPAPPSVTVTNQPTTVVALHCMAGAPLADEIESAMWHFFRGIAIRNLGVFRCVRGTGPSGRVLFQAVSGRYHGLNIDLEARLRTVHGVGPDISPHLGAARGRYQLLAQIKAISVNLDVTVNAFGMPGAAVPGGRMQQLCDFVSLNLVL